MSSNHYQPLPSTSYHPQPIYIGNHHQLVYPPPPPPQIILVSQSYSTPTQVHQHHQQRPRALSASHPSTVIIPPPPMSAHSSPRLSPHSSPRLSPHGSPHSSPHVSPRSSPSRHHTYIAPSPHGSPHSSPRSPPSSHYTLASPSSAHYTPPGYTPPSLYNSPGSSRSSDSVSPSSIARRATLSATNPSSHKHHRRHPSSTESHVRFADDLIDEPPSITHTPRRKGFFNRRGDQLLSNDGRYRPALDEDQFPADLVDYPVENVGWMNEDGVCIDMQCRKVTHASLRPALKKN